MVTATKTATETNAKSDVILSMSEPPFLVVYELTTSQDINMVVF